MPKFKVLGGKGDQSEALKRYIKEIYQGSEPRQDADIIAADKVAPLESRLAINYIQGDSSDD